MASDLLSDTSAESGPKKPPEQILREEITEGLSALELPLKDLFVSGLSAGLDIGFSLFLMAVLWTLLQGAVPPAVLDLAVANAYSVGFIFVVLGRSELFTEQTTLAVLPVLNGRASVGGLGRLWAVVYLANLAGATAFAAFIAAIGPAIGVIDAQAFGAIARPLVDHPPTMLFLSALLAGWLMGLLSWLVAAIRDTIGQIIIVWLIATIIGLAHLQHVVVGSVEVLAGLFAGQGITGAEFGHFLLWTTLGNVVGGSIFVALIKYGHAARNTRHAI